MFPRYHVYKDNGVSKTHNIQHLSCDKWQTRFPACSSVPKPVVDSEVSKDEDDGCNSEEADDCGDPDPSAYCPFMILQLYFPVMVPVSLKGSSIIWTTLLPRLENALSRRGKDRVPTMVATSWASQFLIRLSG